jgi:uncharacterized membrane protein YqhA
MAGEKPATRRLELDIERLILGSRWLQAPLYLGLLVVLAVVVIKFPFKIWELMQRALIVLQRFLEANTMSNDKLYVLMAMHLTFVLSALMLTYIDRLASTKKIDSGH